MSEDILNEPEQKKAKSFAKKLLFAVLDFLKVALIAAIIVLPVRYFVFQPFIVKGESMVPNFQSGDYLIVDEISYKIADPHRGDIVVLKYPLDQSQRFIKRIIGLPGETVDINNGVITIISKEGQSMVLDEKSYLSGPQDTEGEVHMTLSDKEFFVLGDNRPFSYDSRRWGVLPKEDIVGRVAIRVFPVTNIDYFATPTY